MERFFIFLLIGNVVGVQYPVPQGVNWFQQGKDTIDTIAKRMPIEGKAKNVILFLGDGMGISTVTAARIYKGQQAGRAGEDEVLSFEEFANVGLSKVYTANAQVPDSAGTGTAFTCGVKANSGTLGVNDKQEYLICEGTQGNKVSSIMKWSQQAGKRTGIVTSTRVTHATPASSYANTPYRNWEALVNAQDTVKKVCNGVDDIAYQLIHGDTGKDFNVILGGGRSMFYNTTVTDSDGNAGNRIDGRNLPQEWLDMKSNIAGTKAAYVSNKAEFDAVDTEDTDYLLGLLTASHMTYDLEREDSKEPSIADLTETAIKILEKDDDGFMLLVEGARIDHAHHESFTKRALQETVAFEAAVKKALDLTNREDTLIVVTADHSHTLAIGGQAPSRGNDILGKVDSFLDIIDLINFEPLDKQPMTTLGYYNGPNGPLPGQDRRDLTNVDTTADDYTFDALIPLPLGSHSGEDVAIYADGPMAHMIGGVLEQNVIAHVMAYASCVGEYADCSAGKKKSPEKKDEKPTCGAAGFHSSLMIIILTILAKWM